MNQIIRLYTICATPQFSCRNSEGFNFKYALDGDGRRWFSCRENLPVSRLRGKTIYNCPGAWTTELGATQWVTECLT